MGLILPEHYDPRLSVRETQEAIKYIRDTFQKEFGKEMNLERISAPLFVEKSSGLNDDLNGVERPVQFDIAGVPGETVEVVHSLAKWKRMALYKYGFQPGEGLVKDNVEDTIRNMGYVGRVGMKDTDVTILNLMIDQQQA